MAVCTTSWRRHLSLTEKPPIACERVNPLDDGSERSRRGGWRRRTKGFKSCKDILRTTEPRLGLEGEELINRGCVPD